MHTANSFSLTAPQFAVLSERQLEDQHLGGVDGQGHGLAEGTAEAQHQGGQQEEKRESLHDASGGRAGNLGRQAPARRDGGSSSGPAASKLPAAGPSF